MGTRAAIYVRISEDRQRTGVKVGDQETDCRALAERLGLTVVAVYTDNDLTAHKGSRRYKERPAYRDLLTAIRAGRVDVILATETERLHRDSRELLDYIDACQPGDVPTYTVRAGQLDLSTSSGKMVAKILAAKAEHEVEQIRDRMRAARLHKVGRGQWTGGRRPFGYEDDGVTVNQAEAEALKRAGSQALAGSSLNAIVAKLNERQIRTSTGKEWRPTELRRVLIRPRNAGLMVHRSCHREDAHKHCSEWTCQDPGRDHEHCIRVVGRAEWSAILNEDIWRGLCALFGDANRRTNTTVARRWLLPGLARCGWTSPEGAVCGDPVRSFSASAKRRHTKPVYTCRTGKHVIRNAREVDDYVEAVIIERLSCPDAVELLAPDQASGVDVTGLHAQDAVLGARLDGAARAYDAGTIELSQLETITAGIRRQREAVTAALAAASRGSVLAGVADAPDPAKVWAGLDLSRKRAIVEVLLEVVILPTRRGRRPGWRAGESYFDPDSVDIIWKRGGDAGQSVGDLQGRR
jgi:site-specific DNA recombinase